MEAALKVLWNARHPMVALVERDHTSRDERYPLFQILHKDWQIYGRHRYIAVHNWELTEDDQDLLRELNVNVFCMPTHFSVIMQATVDAAATLEE